MVSSISVHVEADQDCERLLARCREQGLHVAPCLDGSMTDSQSSSESWMNVDVLDIFPVIPTTARDFWGRVSFDDVSRKMCEMGYSPISPRVTLSLALQGLSWPGDSKPGDKSGQFVSPTWVSPITVRVCGSGERHSLCVWTHKGKRHVGDYWHGSGFDARHKILAVRSTAQG